MRVRMAHAILHSRVGRKLFAIFFVLVALPVGAMSVLAYQLSEYVLRQSAAELSRELTKAVSIHLIDRLRAGENLLLAHIEAAGSDGKTLQPSESISRVFAAIDRLPAQEIQGRAGQKSSLRLLQLEAADDFPAVELTVYRESETIRARFVADYIWENTQSGTHRLCVAGQGFARPVCQGPGEQAAHSVRMEREIFFQPYFDAPSWTITASLQPDVRRFLPFSLAALIGNVSAIAFLLAVVSSSVVLRRVTRPLDALTSGTRAVLQGDFSQRVVIEGSRSEFTDLADSFNAMTEEVGRDLQLFRLLAQMDQAIIAQRPFGEVACVVLTHLQRRPSVGHVCIVQWPVGAAEPAVLSLSPDGALRLSSGWPPSMLGRRPGGAAAGDHESLPGACHELSIAQTRSQRVWFRFERAPAAGSADAREIEAFRQRLAVALHAEEHEQELQRRSVQDSLTGLLNRFGLVEAISRLAERHASPADPEDALAQGFAVVYMDLDGFKEINDAYGHDVGDKTLKEVAQRLRVCIGEHAFAMARPGGDEFVFVLRREKPGELRADAEAIMQALRAPFHVPPRTLSVTASLGLALYPEHGTSHDELLKHADTAMYTAKAAGRNMLVEFEYSLATELTDRLSMREDLRKSLDRQQMYVVYQPRVDSGSRHLGSVEALLRWDHPQKGLIPPDIFIPLAEESGFILELGQWVLRNALAQLAQWRGDAQVPIRSVSVNLSPLQLAHDAFPNELRSLMVEFAVSPGELELEITEGALVQDFDTAAARLALLRADGVSISLDDFGVGYSSLQYLSRLPFDTLKIDKSFVHGFGTDRPALAIATAIVALARALDKRVLAEGIETDEQARLLEELGVDELQGFVFGTPETPQKLSHHWTAARQGEPA